MPARLTLLATVFLLAGCSTGSQMTPPEASGAMTAVGPHASTLEAHVRFLASDEMLGRRAGTPQDAAAQRYIAEAFRASGVAPVAGAEDGYFQTLPIRDGGTSRNVVGFIEGTDPALRDEIVVLSAHFDGLGASMRRGATEADSIFNGARDNAMGTAAMLEAGRVLAANPPARSVLLFAAAAEEMGLMGSRYYVENPLLPLRQTVFVLNADGAGYSDTSVISVVGLERSTVRPHVEAAAAAAGLGIVDDLAPEANLFARSDNAPFAAKGIPAITVAPGARAFDEPGVADKYHTISDGPEDLDYGYLYRHASAYLGIARRIADADERITWTPGDEYESAARDLYD